MKSFEGDENFV